MAGECSSGRSEALGGLQRPKTGDHRVPPPSVKTTVDELRLKVDARRADHAVSPTGSSLGLRRGTDGQKAPVPPPTNVCQAPHRSTTVSGTVTAPAEARRIENVTWVAFVGTVNVVSPA